MSHYLKRFCKIILLSLSMLSLSLSSGQAQKSDTSILGTPIIIDAGTLKIKHKTIRLHGIIAPTARQKCRRKALPWLCGAAAKLFLTKLTQGQKVRCLNLKSYTARCFLGANDLSQMLVRNGWAVPDENGKNYFNAEIEAQRDKLGLWRYTN